MSSTNPAFVKAFARRNRSQRHAVSISTPQNDPGDSTSIDEPGSLQVDRSVAQKAKAWLDPIEDQIARADAAEAKVPRPHVDDPHVDDPHVDDPQVDDPQVESSHSQVPQVDTETNAPHEIQADPSHVIVHQVSVQSLQHIHTAYATAFANSDLGHVEAAGAATVPLDSPPNEGSDNSDVALADTGAAPIANTGAAQEVTEVRIDEPANQLPKAHYQPETLVPFKAVWEVDVFDIPTLVADLFFDGALFQQIAERMGEAVSSGLNSVLVTSTKQGEGRSSAAIGIAMAAAAAGIRVALVDADTESPTLADDLRLDLQYGWVDTIRGGLPIKEVAVYAVEDGVTLIPLMPPHGPNAATAFEVVQLIGMLRSKFELVIIDGPTGLSSCIHQCASAVDTAIIVRDMTRTDALAINDLSYRLRESGVKGVGVIENFA